ncbi:hypothetical protein K1T71_014637 [Dendrolimus kikuchii]|uniref:Uncharacterized protein n=1 Tax=Dendrolimus kikuchii TaxID=765133 RepID=A0ACC1CEX7_9NEOP|nr:hypothetical protein K1T71_014637 [Dendrolimus kikuchii]
MDIRIALVLIAAANIAPSSQNSVKILFPECHRLYFYMMKINVTTSTVQPTENGTFWDLEGKVIAQVYDNYTRVRLKMEGLKKSVSGLYDGIEAHDKYVSEPWELEYMESGLIKTMYVGNEPIWVTNLKRGISINFQVIKKTGTYIEEEPCLDEVCGMVYTVRDTSIKKFTSYRKPTWNSRNIWSSIPWASDYTGRPVVDSLATAERLYELNKQKGLINLDLKGTYEYKTHDHILAVTSELSLSYDKDIAGKSVEKLNLSQTTVNYIASDYSNPTNGIRNMTQGFLKNRTFEILLKIARKGIDADNIVRDATLIHNLDFIELLNTISRLKYNTFIKLFEDLVLGTSYDMETGRNIFLEVLPHARSGDCARFIKYLVLEEKEKIEDAALLSLIRKLPFNIATYSQSLLEELEVFTRLGLDFPPDIRHAGILSFGTLLHRTMEFSVVKQDYFDNIIVKYFRMYSDCPQYLDRMIWLQGLCNIGFSADSYTRIVYGDSGRDRHERLWAALCGGSIYTGQILQTTIPILMNETEHIQLRIASLHLFLSSQNVRESDFLFIHNYIKNSNNRQMKRFWYASVKNLENNKYFKDYRVATFYVPFIANQISTLDPLYWATDNYIISANEESGSPSLQVLSVGDELGAFPALVGVQLSTGGRRPYKEGIYLLVEGVAANIYRRLFSPKEMDSEKLVKVLKNLKNWSLKAPEKVHVDMIVKIHGKTVYATHMNQSRFESWNGEDLAYIEDFLRFGSHINQQIVYYPYQSDIHMPSELGTPIRLQSTILSFTSIRGNLTAPSTQDLTWRNDLHIRYQGTSVTSLSTDGPLVQTIHTARIQQSLVAHFPMRFNVSFSKNDGSIELTWPNPGEQQGGVAMHSRAQVAMETISDRYNYTVSSERRNAMNKTEGGVFFDCERPLTGAEVFDKILASKTNHYDFLTSVQPSLIILNSILLFTSPPSGSCGLILPPQRLMKTRNDVLQIKFQIKHFSLNEDTTKVDSNLILSYYSLDNPDDVFLKIDAVTKLDNSGDNANLQVIVQGHHPDSKFKKKEWTVCLREQDISHASSDQDTALTPASYEGHFTLTYTGNHSTCFEGNPTSELTLRYKGVPQNLNGKLERYFEVKIFGRDLSEMGILDSDIVSQTAIGQLLRTYNREPLNVTAIIKEKNGLASVNVNRGAEIQFKSDNFAWLLDSWTDMQIMRTFGLYRECRLQNSSVQILSGVVETLPPSECDEYLILADCSDNTPRFAITRSNNNLKVYSGGFQVVITEEPGESKLIVDSSNAGDQFWISHKNNTVKITLPLTSLRVYSRVNETVILVPHMHLNTVCIVIQKQFGPPKGPSDASNESEEEYRKPVPKDFILNRLKKERFNENTENVSPELSKYQLLSPKTLNKGLRFGRRIFKNLFGL